MSLYFSEYPYLYNLLSFNEVNDLFKNENAINKCIKLLSFFGMENSISFLENLLDKMCEKIKNNKSILDDKKELKEIQTYSILYIKNMIIETGEINFETFNYYQIINFFRDLDFCLKLLVLKTFFLFNNKNHNFFNELSLSLAISDKRFGIFNIYPLESLSDGIKNLNEEENKQLNESLSIKDFIIIGNKKFQEKIKTIENNISPKQ